MRVLKPLFIAVIALTFGYPTPAAHATPTWTLLWAEPSHDTGGMGAAMADVGDIDGDGFSDLVAGAPYGVSGFPSAGEIGPKAYVYSGLTGRVLRILRPPLPESESPYDAIGTSVAGPGDLDGDRVPDILLGAPNTPAQPDSATGAIYAISGATGETIYSCLGSPGEALGERLATGFDLDGDGIQDFVSAGFSPAKNTPYVRAFSGGTGNKLWECDSLSGRIYGAGLAVVPDLNADGVADVAVAVSGCGVAGAQDGIYVLSGRTGATLQMLHVPTCGNFTSLGTPLALAGDLDGDGVPDLCVGMPDGGLAPSEVDIESVAGDSLIVRLPSIGTAVDNDLGFGGALATGDLDGDGIVDIAIGAPNSYVENHGIYVGTASLWSGASLEPVFRVAGWDAVQYLGSSVAVTGDTNGDGRNDLAIGAQGVRLTSNGPLVGGVAVYGLAEVRAAAMSLGTGGPTVHLGIGVDDVRVSIEPVGGSFALSDVRHDTVTLRRVADPFRRARAIAVDTTIVDRDGDGTGDIAAMFSRSDVRAMYPEIAGAALTDSVQVDATLRNGDRIVARVLATIQPDASFRVLRVSPNPVRGQGALTVYTSKPGPLRVRLFDVQGRLVATMADETASAPGYHDFSIGAGSAGARSARSGIYFLRVESADGVATKKIAILR